MKRLLILGGGTAGTMVANKLRTRLDREGWQITVVDQVTTTTTSRVCSSSRSASTTPTRSSGRASGTCLGRSTWCWQRSIASRPTPTGCSSWTASRSSYD